MMFISKQRLLAVLVASGFLLGTAGCTPAHQRSVSPVAPAPPVTAKPHPTQPVVRAQPRPKQPRLPASLDPQSIAQARLHGYAIDANKDTHRIYVIRKDSTGILRITLRVGAQFGVHHRHCHSSTSCWTDNGLHATTTKGGVNWKSSNWPYPNGGAPMPYARFFTEGEAFHYGSSAHSHGCIHVYTKAAAKYIYQLPIGTPVVVHGKQSNV